VTSKELVKDPLFEDWYFFECIQDGTKSVEGGVGKKNAGQCTDVGRGHWRSMPGGKRVTYGTICESRREEGTTTDEVLKNLYSRIEKENHHPRKKFKLGRKKESMKRRKVSKKLQNRRKREKCNPSGPKRDRKQERQQG